MNLFQASHAAAAGTSTPNSQPIQASDCAPKGVGNTISPPSQLNNQINAVHAQMTSSRAAAAAIPPPIAMRLTAPYAESLGACALVRGMRPYADADAEIALALMNERLAPRLPTVLLVASAKNVYLSSTFVRDTATLGGMIVPGSVPPPVEAALRERFE